MALQELQFSLGTGEDFSPLPVKFSHTGVVGSGDMEVLLEQKDLGGRVEIKVTTPVNGFDHVWKQVLERFVLESGLGNARIEINDNNSTPYIVALRLKQALLEAKREGGGRP